MIVAAGSSHHQALIVDPETEAAPSSQRSKVLQRTFGPDKRVINRAEVSKAIVDKVARQKVAGYLPQVIERVRKPAAAVAQGEVLPNSVAPEPEVCVAANIDRSDDLAFLIDATGFGDRGAVAFR